MKRERGAVRRPFRIAIRSGAIPIVVALLGGVFACQSVTFLREFAGAPRVESRILEDEVITLVTTRFRSVDAPVYYSARDRYPFEFHFDPALVDLSRVEEISLYRQAREGESYRRIASFPADDSPRIHELGSDGYYGLRASVTYGDGREILAPSSADPPLIRLFVDRRAPAVTWLRPFPGEVLAGDEKVELRWDLRDAQFGDEPAELSWSGDNGSTWLLIDHLPAVPGESSLGWRTPESPPSTALVRLRVRDFVGNEARSTTRLRFSESTPRQELPDIARPAPEAGQPVPATAKESPRVAPASYRSVRPSGDPESSGEGQPKS